MSNYLYLLRHGESEGNVDHNVYAKTYNEKVKLTKKGKKQAQQAAKKIQQEPNSHREPLEMISSPYIRALNTAQIIAKTLNKPPQTVLQNLLVVERNWGEHVGQDVDKPTSILEKFLQDSNSLHYKPPRGESLFEAYVRAGVFVIEQFHFTKYSAIVVSHRDFLVMLHAYLIKEIPTLDRHWDNCEIRKYVVGDYVPGHFTYLGTI